MDSSEAAAKAAAEPSSAATARDHLPDDWSGKGACPVCNFPGQLRVQRQDGAPDRMLCAACGTAFQVEAGGPRVRLAEVPTALIDSAGLLGAWLTPAELRKRVDQVRPGAGESTVEQPVPRVAKPQNGASGNLDVEPGSEDWHASLAAAIGGLAPVVPPPDSVLADELERALSASRAPNPDGAAESPAGAKAQDPNSPAPIDISSVLAAEAAPAAAAVAPQATTPAETLDAAEPAARDASAPAVAAPEPLAVVPAAATVPGAPKPPPPTRRELAERAWKLHELGNSPASIQTALEGMNASPEDVGVVMSKLVALEQARQARFLRNMQWAVGDGAAVVVVLLLIVVLMSLNPAKAPAAVPGASPQNTLEPSAATAAAATMAVAVESGTPAPVQTTPIAPTQALAFNPIIGLINQLLPGDVKLVNGPSPTPAPTSALFGKLFPAPPTETESATEAATPGASQGNLPSWVSTLVPKGITVVNVPTPSVDSNGPPAGPCPTTKEQASVLFGGPASSWSYNRDTQGWVFILANNPTTIRVPAEMSAGYLVIGNGLEMRSAAGPATLHNVNFVAISCQ